MLSRRSVRIKIMQQLYMLNRDESLTPADCLKEYHSGTWETYRLYIFHVYLLLRTMQQAEKDAEIRITKMLPTDEDRAFSPILYTNECTRSLAKHKGFLNLVDKYNFAEKLDADVLRKVYLAFAETEEYKSYLALSEYENKDHLKAIYDLYRFMYSNELILDITEDRFNHWLDDEGLIIGALKKTIKEMPFEGEFYKEFEPTDEILRTFGEDLLRRTCQEDHALFAEIEPSLTNWDADRVAILDMIMLKMALCELLHFPTIPVKVTLNEYVDISKVYSTDKSKEFINGILDHLMKKLKATDRIVKEGRGLIE